MGWFQDNSGALTVLATVVLVAVTAVYVRLTARLTENAREQLEWSRRMHADSLMPIVLADVVTQRSGERPGYALWVDVTNYGKYPASCTLWAPESYAPSHVVPDGNDEGATYFTLRPGATQHFEYFAPVDPDVEIAESPPLTHYQWLRLTLEVRGFDWAATDEFEWSSLYDPAVDSLRDPDSDFFYERRAYFEPRAASPKGVRDRWAARRRARRKRKS